MARRTTVLGLVSVAIACAAGCAAPDPATPEARAGALAAGDRGDLDILFMIDNSSSMTPMQMKMIAQDPGFMKILEAFPNGLPNIHIAVVSSDMGAPGDQTSSIGCTANGDDGVFQVAPRGTCTSTTLASGATFISNVQGNANYTGKLEDVFACIATLGTQGCGFEHQLASVARALGADGSAPPSSNAGFLRPNAELAIVLLTNEDDCSAPVNTTLFSLNGGQQSITNPLGPIANYRCNQFGHLCTDPTSATPNALIAPPMNPPADATGNPPALTLANCQSNDTGTGMLTPIANFVAGIRALKSNPDSQIVVGAISPPVTPYTVEWVPPASPPPGTSGQIWPQVQHSCGALNGDDVNPQATQFTTDGSFGDPGVRVAQWVRAFGDNGVVTSVCDADYSASFQKIADKLLAHLQPSSSTGAGGTSGVGGTAGSNATGVGGAGGHAGAGGAAGAPATGGMNGMGGIAGQMAAAGTSGSGVAGAAGQMGGGAGAGGQATTGAGGEAGSVGHAGGAGGVAITGGGGAAGHLGAAGSGGRENAGGSGGTSSGGAGGAVATAGSGGTQLGGHTGAAGQPGAGGASATGGATATGGAAGTAGAGGTPHENAGGNGCGCETAPHQTNGSALAFLLVAGVVINRRRRR